MARETVWRSAHLPRRGHHRQLFVAMDATTRLLESPYEVDVLTGRQRGEPTYPPIRVGAKSHVGSVDMAVFTTATLRAIGLQVQPRDGGRHAPPVRDAH